MEEKKQYSRIKIFENKIGKDIIEFIDCEYQELIKSFECKTEDNLRTVLATCRSYIKYQAKGINVNIEKHPDSTSREYINNNKNEFILEDNTYITREEFMDFINDKKIRNYRDKVMFFLSRFSKIELENQ